MLGEIMNKSNKLLFVIVILTLAIIVGVVGTKVIVDKTADRVIQKLQKDYSPSPYGPGIDPDKIDAEKLQNSKPQVDKFENWKPN